MSSPRMCDVCKKLEASLPTSPFNRGTPDPFAHQTPHGWQYITLSDQEATKTGEVCSKNCAVSFVDRHWG